MATRKSLPGGRADRPAAAEDLTNPTSPADMRNVLSLVPRIPSELLELTVAHPVPGVCVVAVDGELDALTTPLLNTCIREQLGAGRTCLILDLHSVRFLGSTGLTCLLDTRELTQQIPGAQLHLAGLLTRAVARPLQVTELLELFNTHPTLTDALTALTTDRPQVEPSTIADFRPGA